MIDVDILIENAFVLESVEDDEILENGAVAIKGNRIEEVGSRGEIKAKYRAVVTLDGTNKLAIPGLIDAHIHLDSSLSRGLLDGLSGGLPWVTTYFTRYYPMLNAEVYHLCVLLSCLEMLKTGTTCFCDCGTLPTLEEVAFKAVASTGMRAVLGRLMMDIYDPPALTGIPERFKESTGEGLKRGEDFVKRYHGKADGRITAWLALMQVTNSSDALCLGVKELAEKHHVGVTTHAGVSPAMIELTRERFGMEDIERCEAMGLLGPKFLAAHMGYVNGKELRLMYERKASVVHSATSSMHNAAGRVIRALIPEMVSMGINVALGCDVSSGSNHLDMVRQANLESLGFKEARLNPKLFPPRTVLKMCTANGARALGLEKEVGSLEAGKKADIVLFDLMRPEWLPFHRINLLSNLVYSATGSSVDTVIIDGKIVMQDRKVKTIDEANLLKECQKAFASILKKGGWI